MRFWRECLSNELPLLIIAALLMAIVALTSTSYPILIGAIIDGLSNLVNAPDKIIGLNFTARDFVAIGPILIILVSTIRGVTWYFSTVTTNKAALFSTTRLQDQLFQKLLSLDFGRLSGEQSGAYSARFLNDVNAIREGVLKLANSLVREVLTLIGVVGAMFYADWQLAAVALLILPIAIFPINLIGNKLRKTARAAQDQASELSGVVEESLGGVRLVKTYGMEAQEAARVNNALHQRMDLLMKTIEQRGRIDPILEVLGGLAIAAVFAFAAMRISTGDSSVGDLMSFITSLLLAAQSVRSLGNMNSTVQEGMAGLMRFYQILDEEPLITDKLDAKPINGKIKKLEFENVGFWHGDQQIIKNINFAVKSGQKIAFVGASGSGKSTIINLVPRLFDVGIGEVTIDDIDLRDLKIEDLRKNIALVAQDATMFEATIAQNIAFGLAGATKEQITEALKQAACDFVFELPNGIETMVGPRGSSLSGGERQRLSLARAILRNAPILLLDEPTSALDSENEAKISQSLETFCKDRITLVVAHRLSTVRDADLILVMNEGEIIERGTHEELIANNGFYAELAKLQIG